MRARWKVQRPDVDPWGLVLALASLCVFVLHGFEAALGRDLGLYAYSGQRVAAGEAPYEAVLNRAGPFGHLVNGAGALIARMLHTDDIVTMRWTMTFLTVATVWVLYVVGRDLLDSKLAGVVTAVTFLRFRELLEFATGGPREKPTMLLLVALALLAVTHRRWAVAGVMVALASPPGSQPSSWARRRPPALCWSSRGEKFSAGSYASRPGESRPRQPWARSCGSGARGTPSSSASF